MDIISFQLATKALKKIGMIGSKKVDDTGLQNGQILSYNSSQDKYLPMNPNSGFKEWLTNTAYFDGDMFHSEGYVYEVLVSHTSSSILTDLTDNKIKKVDFIQNIIANSDEFISTSRGSTILANTNFQLPLSMQYTVGEKQLIVQLNNNILVKDVDWFEVDSSNIKFAYDIDKSWVLVVRKIVSTVVPSAAEYIPIKDVSNIFTSDNVEGALQELFQNVDNGKELIATAIVDRGATASVADTFQELSNKIKTLGNYGSGETIAVDYVNVIASESKILSITDVNNDNLLITPMVFIPAADNLTKIVSNLNADETIFTEVGDLIKENGKFINKTIFEINKDSTNQIEDLIVTEYAITGKEFIEIL